MCVRLGATYIGVIHKLYRDIWCRCAEVGVGDRATRDPVLLAQPQAFRKSMYMTWIDLPPVWLFVALLFAWMTPGTSDPLILDLLGACLFAIAALLVVAAVIEFRRARTTIVPHQTPKALITSGIFAYTRNPIYLADVLILLGASLIWSSLVGLLIVFPFAMILRHRFILPEESRMETSFGAEFEAYRNRVRRWI